MMPGMIPILIDHTRPENNSKIHQLPKKFGNDKISTVLVLP
jgi:hypothetical protein